MKSSYSTSINGGDEEKQSLIKQPLLQDSKNHKESQRSTS